MFPVQVSERQLSGLIRFERMSNAIQKAPIKQNQLAKVIPYIAWFYLVGLIVYLSLMIVQAVVWGQTSFLIMNLIGLFVAVWYFGGSLIAIPLGLQFSQGFRPDRVPALHSMHWRVLTYWNRLPLRKDITWAIVTGNFALTLSALGRYETAETTQRHAVSVIEKSVRWQKNYIGGLLINNLAYMVYKQNRFDEAEELCRRSLEICQASGKKGKAFSAFPLLNLAGIEIARGNEIKAKKYLTESIDILESNEQSWAIITESLITARTNSYVTAMLIHLKQDDLSAAQHVWEKIAEEQSVGTMRLSIASMSILAEAAEELQRLGDMHKADLILQTAYSIGREIPDHPDSHSVQDSYQKLLEVVGRGDEIADMRRWILPASALLMSHAQIELR
jgi:tetratricopeptide (TPR) repeat protein